MSRLPLAAVAALVFAQTVFSQENHAESDTSAVHELQEIVIQAPKVVRKADMDVFYPSESAVGHAKNGMQLLTNIMIPGLSVNDALGSVKSAGQDVQLRINGRVASLQQVRTLQPESIKRVEWIDNPGLRYGGANAVVNFIVQNPTVGGSLMAEAMPALNCAWGQYYGSLKINHGRSQWSLDGHFQLTNKIHSHRDYSETFTYPDGRQVVRTETPLDGYIDGSNGHFQASYSYIIPDTTVVFAAIHGYRQAGENKMYHGMMTMSDGSAPIDLRDKTTGHGFTTSAAAYIEQHLPHKQIIVADFNASVYDGLSRHSYSEKDYESLRPITEVLTSIKDLNQAYGIETDYIKNWRNSRLTAGISYSANRNRSTYENLDDAVFHQRQDRLYIFGEYFHRIDRVTLRGGIGAQYSSFKSVEADLGNSSWNVRPQFSATWSPAKSTTLRLDFSSWQSTPSLSETNPVPQQIDGFQWRVGNPEIKTSSSYMLTARYNFTFRRVMGTFGIRAFTSPDAIAPFLTWQQGRLITSYENSRGLQNISFFLAPQIEIIPGWVTLSGMIQYRAERMRGSGYKLYNHDWSGYVEGMVSHWGFSLSASYQRAQKDLWGQGISWGESVSAVRLSYDWKNWQVFAGMLMPFNKYDRGSRSLNPYNTNSMHIRLDMAHMPFIGASLNLNWGRQKQGARKLINVNADVQTSSAAGR